MSEDDNKVIPVFGGYIEKRIPCEETVQAVERLLEQCRSGEIIGVAFGALYHDLHSTYTIAGRGLDLTFSLVGAIRIMLDDLASIHLEEEGD